MDMTNKAKIKQQIEIIRKKTFLDATLDRVFKMLFSVDSALIHFLNAILHLPDATKIVSISRPKKVTVKLDSGEGSEIVRFDIHAKLKNKQFIDLEMQRAGHTDFLDRIELYSSLLEINSKISFDKGRPKREKNVHPYLMPETYSIWLCNFKVPFSKSYREELGLFRLSDIGNPKALPIYTKKRYIIIDLTKYKAARNTPEAEWLKLIATSASATSAPKTTDKAIADAYSRLQVKNAS
ncbi:PD-(D/E)XK nuclease family transposase, partial [Fibrobacter sp. UWEL]|uniref:PD-(D/E)XK nuclease family transposase n=1 Tax=Fibrobacter sp. UWEL TaxID=1896209 RepID=UPI00116084CE